VPLRFGKPQPFTRADSVRPTIEQYTELSDGMANWAMSNANLFRLQTKHHVPAAELARTKRNSDSVSDAYQTLLASRFKLLQMSTNAVVVGQEVVHSWRVGERVDSAYFVVFNNGTAERL
jgi:hypothetical protein